MSGVPERTVAELDNELADCRRELAELREAVRILTDQAQDGTALAGRKVAGAGAWRGRTSRRSLLRGGAWLAAISAAGAATLSRTRPAEATDGNAIVAGANNTTAGTRIWSQSGPNANITLLTVDGSNGTTAFSNTATLAAVGVTNRDGIDGYCPGLTGVGVRGSSNSGSGVVGASGTGVDVSCLGTGRFQMSPQVAAGPATAGLHSKGEMLVDARGDPYVCTSTGVPGTWNAVGNLRPFSTARRVYASVSGVAGTTYGPVSALTDLASHPTGVPAGAVSAFCAVQSFQAGIMTLFPDGAADPGIANWSGPGTSGILNILYLLVPLSTAGKFKIHTYFSGSIYVDVWGYVL